MPGLTIVVASADPDRFHAALSVAAANAAIGERSRIFLQGEAATLIANCQSAADAGRGEHGIPTVQQLLDEALALGVETIVCQSGLLLAGLDAGRLPAGFRTGGLVELLASRGDDQLLIA